MFTLYTDVTLSKFNIGLINIADVDKTATEDMTEFSTHNGHSL
jgi:hypothetical protein